MKTYSSFCTCFNCGVTELVMTPVAKTPADITEHVCFNCEADFTATLTDHHCSMLWDSVASDVY